MDKDTDRVFGFDLMISCAICMVLLSQFVWVYPQNMAIVSHLSSLLHYIGIEIFFVFSGFLMSNNLFPIFNIKNFSYLSVYKFILKIIIKVLPLYFLILIINILVAFHFGLPIDQCWKYFLFLQNFTTPISNLFSESWLISIAIFAGIIFLVSLLFFKLLLPKSNNSRVYLITALLLIIFFLITKCVYNSITTNNDINHWDVSLKSVVIYRLDSVFIGVLFHWIYKNFYSFWTKNKVQFFIFGCLGMIFIFVGVGYFKLGIEKYPLFWNVFYLPITSLTIAFFLPFFSQIKEQASINKVVVYISNHSYAIYLLHFGIVLQLLKYFSPIDILTSKEVIFLLFLYLIITTILSHILNQYYQKPISNLFRNSKMFSDSF